MPGPDHYGVVSALLPAGSPDERSDIRGSLHPLRWKRSRLFGFLQPVLPGGGPGSEAALGAGAQPIAELRGNVAERPFHAELDRGVHRPIGIVEDFPSHRDQIGLPVTQDLLGLVAMDDEADRHRHDIGMALHIFRQRHLVAVFDFLAEDRRHLGDAAGRAVDDVDAF